MRRSEHVAVVVPSEKVEAAILHYKTTLGVVEQSRSADGVELKGENFTLWIDATEDEPVVLQEFVPADPVASRALHESQGCEIYGESELGFHVRDPYGLRYHVWTKADT
jgi:hypothetical protein